MNAEYMVTKANTLITASYSLSQEEQRIVLTLISLVQPDDTDFNPYVFRISDFMELLGIQDKSKYTQIPKITKSLMKKVFDIHEDDTLLQLAWICGAKYNKGKGTVTLTIAPDLKPYLLGMKEFFTTYRLESVIRLTGKYSIRMYEILKSREFRKIWEISVTQLSDILKLPLTYSDFFNLKKRVLEPSQEEINAKTDIMFDYETITERKKVVTLKFHIRANPKNAEKDKTTLSVLPEPQKSLEQTSIDKEHKTEEDIEDIKRRFQHNYKGELVDKFVREMIEKKGSKHVYQCLTEFRGYIDGQDIRNVAGLFYTFVIDGLVKPVVHKGNVPQRDNFEQREYSDEFYESCYTNFIDMGIAPVRKK